MRQNRPSFTAAWVAGCRGLTRLLPPAARLVEDPFGLEFGGPLARALDRAARLAPAGLQRAAAHAGPATHTLVWMQVRTRALDDALRDFVRDGGRQVVLLGAGFDCRAARLADVLGRDATVFEVDHPATQARKRAVIDAAGARAAAARYVAWDFERDAMDALPARLAAEGHDPRAPTLTIWEGVTMYLTEPAIEASVAAVRAYSTPGARFAITYFDRARVERPSAAARLASAVVARVGEPFRWGWDPAAFPAWMAARGFDVRANEGDVALAARLGIPRALARSLDRRGGYVALAVRQRDERAVDPARGA